MVKEHYLLKPSKMIFEFLTFFGRCYCVRFNQLHKTYRTVVYSQVRCLSLAYFSGIYIFYHLDKVQKLVNKIFTDIINNALLFYCNVLFKFPLRPDIGP